jgi:hypothetical protein
MAAYSEEQEEEIIKKNSSDVLLHTITRRQPYHSFITQGIAIISPGIRSIAGAYKKK